MPLRKNIAAQNFDIESKAGTFDGGTLEIYTGGQPASANIAPSGDLLVTITLPSPAFGSATAGVVTKAGTWQDTAIDDGTAGWGRFTSADTLIIRDWACTDDPLETDDLLLNTLAITNGMTVTVIALTMAEPAN